MYNIMYYSIIFYIIFFILILNYISNCNTFNLPCNKIVNTKTCNVDNIKNFMNGYWSSDNDFATESEIDEMILNIDIESMTGFLVIIVDKKIILNNDFDILLTSNNIEFISDDINFIWNDKKFKIKISKDTGLLQLFYNNVLYASLYKDNKITAIFNK